MPQAPGHLLATTFLEAAERHRAPTATHGVDPLRPSKLDAFLIELYCDGEPALVLALSADGAVNRLRSGKGSSLGNKHEHAIIAQTHEPFFEQATELFDPSWHERAGVHWMPPRLGASCLLRITLVCLGRPFSVLEFHFGSDSQGPPREIRQFVIRAVEVTQSWYDEENRRIDRLKKPWWKFW